MRLTLPLRCSNFVKKLITQLQEPDMNRVIDRENFELFLKNYDNILALTGAGVSTESGLPDYRSEDGLFGKSNYKPVQYSEFIKSPDARRRFWARNYVGWPRFSAASPNKTHRFFVNLGLKQEKLLSIITQNVDGLHHKAGSNNVVELHGNSFWVKCLGCKSTISRYDFQKTLAKLNPECNASTDVVRPDGDVELSDMYCVLNDKIYQNTFVNKSISNIPQVLLSNQYCVLTCLSIYISTETVKNFVIPDCESCGGILKPTVVFFGDNVPQARVKHVEKLVEDCQALLVMGTTLSTLSSLRIVNQAFDLCKFICIVNNGATKGDKMADLLISVKFSEFIPYIRME